MRLPLDIDTVKGFLDPQEGRALYDAALAQAMHGPCLEIGSYCGKSTVYLGTACRERNGVLFAVDHHRGSEENQPGQLYHDPDLFDAVAGAMDTLPHFRNTLRRAELEGTVIPVVGESMVVARHWHCPLAFVFIDGGHAMETTFGDYVSWTPHLAPGGILAIHDVFPNPEDGGRPPFGIYTLARRSGTFEEVGFIKSLALLKRVR